MFVTSSTFADERRTSRLLSCALLGVVRQLLEDSGLWQRETADAVQALRELIDDFHADVDGPGRLYLRPASQRLRCLLESLVPVLTDLARRRARPGRTECAAAGRGVQGDVPPIVLSGFADVLISASDSLAAANQRFARQLGLQA